MVDDSVMEAAQAERADIAAFVAGLSPAQWGASTLCERWTVKDVVAHMVSYDILSTGQLIARLAKGCFVWSNQIGVDALAPLGPQELVDLFGEHLRPRGLTAGFGGMIGLVDGTVHHQDIRRALGAQREIPPDRLRAVLDAVPPNPRLGAWRRIRGLRLRATDIDWNHGAGREVTGTGEALLMAITGRRSVVNELSGPGLPILAARL